MELTVKAYVIDRRVRAGDTYEADLQELEIEVDEMDYTLARAGDWGHIGKQLKNLMFGPDDHRYFVKVIGIQYNAD